MTAPREGPLLASGRDADIYEYGPTLVLRRTRDRRSMVTEARTMDLARSHGFPVPAVDHVSDDGTELVMERIDGVSMVDAMTRRPWTMRRQGALLGELHQRLHAIAAPDWLPAAPGPTGDRLVHLDLHPLNVLCTRRGPVVIDWPAAARGAPGVDVALTWAVILAGTLPSSRVLTTVLGRARAVFVNGFLGGVERDDARRHLAAAVEWKVADRNLSTAECDAMRRLARAEAIATGS